ncbi:unnamed protein product, partial [Prorocentrum cordatum]
PFWLELSSLPGGLGRSPAHWHGRRARALDHRRCPRHGSGSAGFRRAARSPGGGGAGHGAGAPGAGQGRPGGGPGREGAHPGGAERRAAGGASHVLELPELGAARLGWQGGAAAAPAPGGVRVDAGGDAVLGVHGVVSEVPVLPDEPAVAGGRRALHRGEEEEVPRRWLLSLAQVCRQHDAGDSPRRGRARALQDAGGSAPSLKPASSAHSLSKPVHGQKLSAANLLGLGGSGHKLSAANLLGLGGGGREQSVNDMLKMWEGNGDITDADLQLAKWTDLASFFCGEGKGEVSDIAAWLRRGNLEDWVSHYWFRGAHAEELKQRSPNEGAELSGLVNLVLENMGLDLQEGRNDRVHAVRVWSDPLKTLHRPLLLYVGTTLLCPLMTMQVMSMIGFRKERIGGLTYWHRLPCSGVDPAADIAGAMQTPMVVVHGLGVGLVPYYLFVLRLARTHSGDIFVPDLPFLATAPWLSVPSPREVVAQLTDMLRAHGHTAAHFTGHSFGAVVVGWVLKMSPSSVVCVTLLDPACFLVMSAECCVKICCGPVNSAVEILARWRISVFRSCLLRTFSLATTFGNRTRSGRKTCMCPL